MKEFDVMKVLQILNEEKPNILWISFPCGPSSSIQELNSPQTAERRFAKRWSNPTSWWINGIRIMEPQAAAGRHVVQEWPLGNRAWGFNVIKTFWDRTYER